MFGHHRWERIRRRKDYAIADPRYAERVAAFHQEIQEETRLLRNLKQPLARAAGAPEPWATDVRNLVGLVRSLSGDLAASEAELAHLRQRLASRDDSA